MEKKLTGAPKTILRAMADGWVLKCSTGFGEPKRAHMFKATGPNTGYMKAVRMDVFDKVRLSGMVRETFSDWWYIYTLNEAASAIEAAPRSEARSTA